MKRCALVLLFALLFCVGCSEEKDTAEPTPTTAPEPSLTAEPSPTETTAPTETPTPTPTEAVMKDWDTSNVDISWIDPNKKLVAFTFDDGPTQYYDDILDILQENGMHATFFVWGKNYNSSYEDVMKRVVAEGSELGNHTWSHQYLSQLDEEGIAEEIEKTRALLEDLTGIQSFLVRPPYGDSNLKVQMSVNVPMINWSVDSGDWNNGSYESVYENVMSKIQDGDIVLMHASYAYTVEAVRTMIPELIAEGYQIVSVSELAAVRGKTLTAGHAPYTNLR